MRVSWRKSNYVARQRDRPNSIANRSKNARVDAGQSSAVPADGLPKAFDRQGGVVAFSDPNDAETVLGDYTYLITILDDFFRCDGFMQWYPVLFHHRWPRKVFWSCEGFAEFRIPTDDDSGNFHEINIYCFSNNVGKKKNDSWKGAKGGSRL